MAPDPAVQRVLPGGERGSIEVARGERDRHGLGWGRRVLVCQGCWREGKGMCVVVIVCLSLLVRVMFYVVFLV